MNKVPHRQFCALCHREYAVDFHVPNDVWATVVHPSKLRSLHCLSCFTARADSQLVEWDKDIAFYPTSLATHLRKTSGLRERGIAQ